MEEADVRSSILLSVRTGGAKTLFSFFLLPLISLVATLIAIPVLTREGGANGWAAVAIAQGVGYTAGLVVSFGWLTVGPAQVARNDAIGQRHTYWISSLMRLVVFGVTAPVAALIAIALVDARFVVVALLVNIAITAQGLSPGWYLVGQGRPLAIAAMETAPRAAAQLVSVAAVAASHSLLWYGVILLLSEAMISAFAFLSLARRDETKGASGAQLVHHFREQWPLAVAAIVASGYTRAAVPIVSGIAYSSVPVFAALDRVALIGRTGLRPLNSFFQGWVVRGGDINILRRARTATIATVALGISGGAVVAAALPQVDSLLFSGVIEVSSLQALLVGVSLIFASASGSTSLYYLAPRGAVRALSVSTIVGTIVGVPLIIALTHFLGATGAVLAVTIAEGVVLAIQTSFVLRGSPGSRA